MHKVSSSPHPSPDTTQLLNCTEVPSWLGFIDDSLNAPENLSIGLELWESPAFFGADRLIGKTVLPITCSSFANDWYETPAEVGNAKVNFRISYPPIVRTGLESSHRWFAHLCRDKTRKRMQSAIRSTLQRLSNNIGGVSYVFAGSKPEHPDISEKLRRLTKPSLCFYIAMHVLGLFSISFLQPVCSSNKYR